MLTTFRNLILSAILLVAPQIADAQAELPLVQGSNVAYVGAFNVPYQCGKGSLDVFGWGGKLSRSTRGLYFTGLDTQASVGEISIPDIGATAQVLTPCTRVPGADAITNARVGGTMLWGSKVIISGYDDYDASNSVRVSHMTYDTSTMSVTPFVQVGRGGGFVGGYMTPVPQEWVTALSAPALTGQCCINIINRTNWGYGLSGFNPSLLGKTAISAQDLLAYTEQNPLAPPAELSDVWNHTALVGGVVFPPQTRSIIFIGRIGTTKPCYGEAPACSNTGGSPYKGYHGAPYVTQMVAYDALHLADVRAGLRTASSVRPYARWTLPQLNGTISGATYDPTSKRFYITEAFGDRPRVHIFSLNMGVVQPPPTETFTYTMPATTVTGPLQTIVLPGQTVSVPAQTVTCTRPTGGTWSCK